MRGCGRKFCFVLAWVLLLCSPLSADSLRYTVIFKGLETGELLLRLQEVSELVHLKDKHPRSTTALHRRIEHDIPELVKVLHAYGYYDGRIHPNIEEWGERLLITLTVRTGIRYTIQEFEVVPHHSPEPWEIDPEVLLIDPDYPFDRITTKDTGITLGSPAVAKDVLNSHDAVTDFFARHGFPLARIVDDDIIVDEARKTMSVTLHVDSGPLAYFGKTEFEGLNKVRPKVVEQKIIWEEGELYAPEKVQKTKRLLENSGLFVITHVEHAKEIIDDHLLPMTISVSERKSRSVAAGVSWSTHQNFGVGASWENRNFRNLGQTLRFSVDLTEFRQVGLASYRKPHFMRPTVTLVVTAAAEHEDTVGFQEQTYSLTARLEKKIKESILMSVGNRIEYERATETDNSTRYTLYNVPFFIRWNTTNNLFNPTDGETLDYNMDPFVDIAGNDVAFLINQIEGTIYRSLSKAGGVVFAGRLLLGSIVGASRFDVPPPKRFYEGSERSMRGYSYRSVGPFNATADPIGGRSVMVASAEFRLRFTEYFGIVGFFELGNVFPDIFPRFNRKYLKSIGGGLRYFTPVGPVRVDVGFPLDRRPVDSNLEIYLSIGQAF